MIIAFGFFLFDVSVKTTAALEHPVHGLIEDMFGRVHARISFFFHSAFPDSFNPGNRGFFNVISQPVALPLFSIAGELFFQHDF